MKPTKCDQPFHPWRLSKIIKFSNPIIAAVNGEHLNGAASLKLILRGCCVIIIIKMCESNTALDRSWVSSNVSYRHHKIATRSGVAGFSSSRPGLLTKAVNLISIAEKEPETSFSLLKLRNKRAFVQFAEQLTATLMLLKQVPAEPKPKEIS